MKKPRTETQKLPPGLRLAQCAPYFAKGLTNSDIVKLVGVTKQRVAKLRREWEASTTRCAPDDHEWQWLSGEARMRCAKCNVRPGDAAAIAGGGK